MTVAALGVASLALTIPAAWQAQPSSARPSDSDADAIRSGLFSGSTPERLRVERAGHSAEIGMRFSPRRDGTVSAVHFYKPTTASRLAPTRASLWNADGDRLATVRVPRTRDRGWISVSFPSPETVDSGETYTVSAFSPRGGYAMTKAGFTSRVRGGGLVARAKGNGVIRTTETSAFPRKTTGHNYWLDVTYEGKRRKGQSPTPTSAPTTTATPTPTPTTTATPTPTPTTTATAAQPGTPSYPTAAQAGVPDGWTPATTYNGNYRVTTPGAVVQDLRVNGSIIVQAPNVTLRRVDVVGGGINNFEGATCANGLLIEDSTVRRSSATTEGDFPAIQAGGYTARRVEIDGLPEGFRVGGRSAGCGPVSIEGSFARIVRPDICGDWHGDGIQGYDGPALTVRNTTLELVETGCGGTAPFFYPKNQGNTSVDIDGLLVKGGGYAFRLGMPGTVRNLAIVSGSYYYGPLNVQCSALSVWDARIVTVAADGVVSTVRSQPCDTQDGS